jgi:hypothetical protein
MRTPTAGNLQAMRLHHREGLFARPWADFGPPHQWLRPLRNPIQGLATASRGIGLVEGHRCRGMSAPGEKRHRSAGHGGRK